MIFDVETIISSVSEVFTLEENDIILTGTPSGVSKVVDGDVITAGITGNNDSTISFKVKQLK